MTNIKFLHLMAVMFAFLLAMNANAFNLLCKTEDGERAGYFKDLSSDQDGDGVHWTPEHVVIQLHKSSNSVWENWIAINRKDLKYSWYKKVNVGIFRSKFEESRGQGQCEVFTETENKI